MMHSNFWGRKMEDISESSDRQGREREREKLGLRGKKKCMSKLFEEGEDITMESGTERDEMTKIGYTFEAVGMK